MSSRPAKRAKLDNNLHPLQSSAPKLLARLSKPSLCSLAFKWLTEQHPTSATAGRLQDDSDESDEEGEEEGTRDLNKLYQDMRDNERVTKSKVIARIGRDWKQGFTYRQIAQLDVQYLLDKPNSKSWTAYQLIHDGPSPLYATPAQLLTRLRAALGPYYNHHLHLHVTPTLTLLRLQLLPTSLLSTAPSSLHSSLTLLLLPQTPFLLLPSLPLHLAPILLQCLTTSVSTPPARDCRELDLKGRSWEGLRGMLLERGSQGGGMAGWRKGKGEGGGPLVPEGRRVVRDDSKPPAKDGEPPLEMVEGSLQALREKEVGQVWGREELPVLERLDYEISLPYPNLPPPSPSSHATSQPPFLLRLEGTHVLAGLRAAVAAGLCDGFAASASSAAAGSGGRQEEEAEGGKEARLFRQKGGLPEWIGDVISGGRNLVKVGGAGGAGGKA